MKLSFKTILSILLIFTLLILFAGCFITPSDEQPGYTPGTITGIIAAPCCSTSADPVPDPCCIAPEYWCYYCENTWSLQDNIKVVLTYGEDEIATVFTNEDGEYTFTNVAPGKNYVITALCPDYDDDRPLVKDVALELIEGGSFDTKITDCVSTALGLVVDYLVENTELTPEEIVLDGVIAGIPNFYGFPEFKKLVLRICEISTGCVNLFEDEKVMDYLCRAAQEIGRKVLPKLNLACTAGFTYGDGEVEDGCEFPISDAGGPYSATVCTGANALIDLTGSGNGSGTLSYAWDLDADGLFDDSALASPQDVSFGVGVHTVALQVTDICGSTTDTATVTITECINTAPKVEGIPRQAISAEGVSCIPTYELTVSNYASDDVGDNLTYSFVGSVPTGMIIDPDSGKISGWVPECCLGLGRCHQCCEECVTVRVQDDGCCQPSYTDVTICIEVWNGTINGGDKVGIGFDGAPFYWWFCY